MTCEHPTNVTYQQVFVQMMLVRDLVYHLTILHHNNHCVAPHFPILIDNPLHIMLALLLILQHCNFDSIHKFISILVFRINKDISFNNVWIFSMCISLKCIDRNVYSRNKYIHVSMSSCGGQWKFE